MRYFELLNRLKNISTTHVLVHEYGEGDIYEYLNSGEHKYPCVFLTVSSIKSSVTGTSYNFTLFYTDRLVDNSDNKVSVQSTGINVLQQIINRLLQEYPMCEASNIDYTPFTEKFTDMCAGVFCDVVIDNPLENTTDEVECYNEGNFESKTITLTKNGLYDVIGYDKAIVDVEDIPLDTLDVTENGSYTKDKGGWDEVNVNVNVPLEDLQTIYINDIGNYSFTVEPNEGYEGIKKLEIHNNTEEQLENNVFFAASNNGDYFITATQDGYVGMKKVLLSVNVEPDLEEGNFEITENGEYLFEPINAEGFSSVSVTVSSQPNIISLTQSQYNALEDYPSDTIYLITYDDTLPSNENENIEEI